MNEPQFDVRFDEDAYKEYTKLDDSVAVLVDHALEQLELRANEVGKMLANSQSTKLHGCKEMKLRSAGIRIVFRVTNQVVDVLRIVYVLTIEKRQNDIVFRTADQRLRRFKIKTDLKTYFSQSRKWKRRRQRNKPDKVT